MKLSQLLEPLATRRIEGALDAQVCGLFYDSRQVEPGGAFFALPGEAVDGHAFIDDAVARGAVVVFMEQSRALPSGVTGVVVEQTRRAMALAAAAFYGQPTAGIPVAGVTGTNGKTTVTYLLEAMLRNAGRSPAVLGTVNYRFGDQTLPSHHTTPESVDLLRMIAEFRRQGADALVLEVSSHALEQQRVAGIEFDVGVFTNLTPEHLDYHGDMEGYFASKLRLFTEFMHGGQTVANIDDPYGARLARELPQVMSCGLAAEAAVHPATFEIDAEGIRAQIVSPAGEFSLRSPLIGAFNLQNLLCAAAAGLALGLAPQSISAGIAEAPQVPGRMERVPNERGILAVVDYAHTGDALENVLATLSRLKTRRLITVFGCGGDRDRSKRPVMGEAAARYSDLVVVTSDNPRGEDPVAILDEVRPGVKRHIARELAPEEFPGAAGKGFAVVADRGEAIALAASAACRGDLLLVAGKGHEDYQIIGSRRIHFDDREQLRNALSGSKEA